jgi:DNA end-binding protein Ku
VAPFGTAGHPVAMRAIWKGAVSFGLVSVPVKLYSATESKDISFRQVHAKDGGRIKYQRVCSIDGEEVAYADIAKGYETEDGEMVILDDSDMAELPASSSREISVEKFVPSEQIDPMLFEKSYYLEPEKSGAKPYALLRQALEEADRMALVTVSLRNRMSLAVLRVRDDVIVLQTMMWPDEIRKADFGSVDTADAKPAEVKMANMLVETLAGDFEPDDYEDDYREAVESLVKAKIEGGEVKAAPKERKTGGEVVDLLAALQRSVEAAKTARGEETDADAGEKSAKRTAKKTAKKSATKKTAAKKTTAKKTAAKKATTKKAAAKKTTAKKTTAKKSAAKKS